MSWIADRSCFLVLVVLLAGPICPAIAEQGLQIKLGDQTQTILPLGYTSRNVVALKRNGYMLNLRPHELKEPQVVPQFQPFSQQEMRAALMEEFGRSFDVTGTGHYLIVHPRGARDLWANRFEELYRSMVHFFRTRGFPLGKSRYPLVGIVFYSQQQYLDYNSRVLKSNASGSYGVYMPTTNRIYLYDATQGNGRKSTKWEENLATVMHEAAHQTAFNSGIHVRGGETPFWVAEGLGCLFECKGIYNTFKFKRIEHRINYGRLQAFRTSVKQDTEQVLRTIVAGDKLFRRDPGRAYAAAWALTFYLSEREPRKYIRFLRQVATHKAATAYPKAIRVREFNKIFGGDYQMLAARLNRYIDELPAPIRSGR